LELVDSGKIPKAPENEDYGTMERAAGTDELGPLPIGQGRVASPYHGNELVNSYLMVGTVSNTNAQYRWSSTLKGKFWNIHIQQNGTYYVYPYATINKDDSPLPDYADSTPSSSKKIYAQDASGIDLTRPEKDDAIGDGIYSERQFVWTIQSSTDGGVTWNDCATLNVQQVISAKRIANTGVAAKDWEVIKDTVTVGKIDVVVTVDEARSVIGGNSPIVIYSQ
jgi:hypothetical protein